MPDLYYVNSIDINHMHVYSACKCAGFYKNLQMQTSMQCAMPYPRPNTR